MSNYIDTIKEAAEKGIILDMCGDVTRYYDFGLYTDLCGLDPQEVLENMRKPGQGGGGESVTKYSLVQIIDGVKTTTKLEPGTLQIITCDYSSTYPESGYVVSWNIPSTITPIEQDNTHIKFAMPSANVTVTATHIAKMFDITFLDKDGNVLETKEFAYNTTPSYTAPTVEGYRFTGWEPQFVKVTGEATYQAKYEVKKYSITYKITGEQDKIFNDIAYGSPITAYIPETKEGYTFSGWDKTVPATMPASNLVFSGQYNANHHTITINGEVIDTEYGVSVEDLVNTKLGPVETYYERTITPNITTIPDEDVVVTVVDTPIEYTVSYTDAKGNRKQVNANVENWEDVIDEIKSSEEEANPGYEIELSGVPSEFKGNISGITVSKTPIPYTLTWKIDDETFGEVEYNIENNNVETLLTDVYNTDKYNVTAWKNASGETVTELPIGGEELFAESTIKEYKLNISPVDSRYTIKVNGEIYDENKTYPYDTKDVEVVVTINDTEKYNFVGGGDTYATTIEKVGVLNVITIPNIEGDAYTLKYFVDDSQYGQTETYRYGDAIIMKDVPTKEGYNGSWDNVIDTMPANDVVITAIYEAISYTITIPTDERYTIKSVNGEPYNPSDKFEYGSTIVVEIELNEDQKDKYHFNESGDTWVSDEIVVNENTVVSVPALVPDVYELTYKLDGEQYGEVEEHAYDSDIVIKANPSKTGYTFSEWSGFPQSGKMPANNVEVIGTFEIKTNLKLNIKPASVADADKYDIYVNGSLYDEDKEYTYNDDVNIEVRIKDEFVDEYHFIGEPNSGDTWTYATKVEEVNNIDIPVLVKDVYTITLNGEHVTFTGAGTYPYGSQVNISATPDTGYDFVKWSDDVTDSTRTIEVTSDITLESIVEQHQYTLTYKLDGEEYETEEHYYDDVITPISNPAAKTGYTFSGWSAIPATMPANDVEVTGSYIINVHTLTMVTEDGTNVENVNYGTVLTTVPGFVKDPIEGYTFNWYTTVAYTDKFTKTTMPDENVMIFGKYDEIPAIQKKVFYGTMLNTDVDSLSEEKVLTLNSMDEDAFYAAYDNEKNYFIEKMADDNEYRRLSDLVDEAELEGEATDEYGVTKDYDGWLADFENYQESHRYSIVIVSYDGLKSIKLGSTLTANLVDSDNMVNKIVDVEGITYKAQCYDGKNSSFSQTDNNINWKLFIKKTL